VNSWKGTKAPLWQKAGARKDNGKLQKQIRAAFVASGGQPIDPHDLVRWCYPRDYYMGDVRDRGNRARAVKRAASQYCDRVDDWRWRGHYTWRLKPEFRSWLGSSEGPDVGNTEAPANTEDKSST
jgi:hypothetical protein